VIKFAGVQNLLLSVDKATLLIEDNCLLIPQFYFPDGIHRKKALPFQ
jgi:hypothetical protein